MGLLSRLTSRESSSQQTSGSLWRRSPLISVTAGDEVAITYKRGGAPVILPSFALDFLQGCEDFRPLEAHLAEHADKHGWTALQVASLQSWLPKLIEAEILVSSAAVIERCRASAVATNIVPPITAIGFPTGGDRVPIFSAAAESFLTNLREFEREAEVLVADSSAAPEQREAFRRCVAELSRTHGQPLNYAGEEEKRAFATALVGRSGCAPESVEFALFDPFQIGFACGANRNAILLHGAGRMICSVDDDVFCRLAMARKPRAGLALFSECDPFSRWLFRDRASALAAPEPVSADFLALHEVMLGRDLGPLLPGDPGTVDFSQANDEILRRIEQSSPRVRATFAGHVGDPGIPSSAYYLYYEGENLERLTGSEEHYRSVFASRSVLTLAPGPAIGDASVSPGMAMGLDHRELLPPSFPVLHAEDFIFGATVWQCCPDAVLGHLPCAIAHEPALGKPILCPWELNAERRVVIFEFAHLMRRLILSPGLPVHASAAERMQTLGRILAEIGRLPGRDFRDFLRVQTMEHESERLDYLEKQLRENADAPEFWRHDVQALLEHSREALGYDDFDIPFDLKKDRSADENRVLMQALIARYGALLQDWQAIVKAARELRDEGAPLFRDVRS